MARIVAVGKVYAFIPGTMKTRIEQSSLDELAMVVIDNVKDTPVNAWDSLEQAIRMHADDISECAQDRFGRRLTAKEWKKVAEFALRVGGASASITYRFIRPTKQGTCSNCGSPPKLHVVGFCMPGASGK